MPETDKARELRWQASADADALMIVTQLAEDKARMKRAKTELNRQVKEQEDRTVALKKAAGKGNSTDTEKSANKAPQSTSKPKPTQSLSKRKKSTTGASRSSNWQNR